MKEIKDIETLKQILLKCWSQKTCYPSMQKAWNQANPSIGQCAITSLLVQKYFGGQIKKCTIGSISHYYNEISGTVIDLTKEQFNKSIEYKEPLIKTKDDILSNPDTKNRYELLIQKMNQVMEKEE